MSNGLPPWKLFLLFFAALLVALGFLFHKSFEPGVVQFSNDGPLGAFSAQWILMPGVISGVWCDLGGIGLGLGSWPIALSPLLRWVLGPLGFAKFYVPISLLFFGCCAWIAFRTMKLSPWACVLGGLAALLNSAFLSLTCWGVGSQVIAFGFEFLAVAAILSSEVRKRWLKLTLAGAAVGMGLMEGQDNGAIFSLMIAALVVYQAWWAEGSPVARLTRGAGRTLLIAVVAAVVAAQIIATLVGSQIKGIAGTGEDTQSKTERWDWATQWSLPKRETLQLIMPGLFGYRMDTADGGNYWGAIGRDPNWDRWFANGKQGPPPQGTMRFVGSGVYAGVPVVLIALWAALQSMRRKDSAFSLPERKFIWFWVGVILVCIPLAWGRFALFYHLIYHLPYFSNIRNPIKFMHPASFSVLILFAFGVEGLWRRYVQVAGAGASGVFDRLKAWWARAGRFDRRWVYGCAVTLAVALVGWLVFSSSREAFERYLQEVQFDAATAAVIAGFSIRQVGWFVLFFVLGAGLVLLILAGVFAGRRAKWAGILLGLLVVVDLGRAARPWIVWWDYPYKYATNPIIDILRQKPYEQRVAFLPFRMPPQMEMFQQLYRIEWAQHHFLYNNIQSLDVVQMPRMPVDLLNFETALRGDGTEATVYKLARRWQLTNTRYLLGPAGFLQPLDRDLDAGKGRFRIAAAFDLAPKPGVQQATKLEDLTAVIKPDGQCALFEFTGALPRAQLFSNWQVNTNDKAVLAEISSKDFDPFKAVVVSDPLPKTASPATNQAPGKVEFASYAPKKIVLKTDAAAPSVLLLNDRYDANWKVRVDGKSEKLLRCNYLMRGVYMPAGAHTVEFEFTLPLDTFYVSLAATLIGIALCGFLIVTSRKPPPQTPAFTGP